jgi:hypothetical protein
MAIHYKETAFVALAAFAFCHLLLSWKKSKLGVKIFDGLIILSSFIYLLLYYFIVYSHLDPSIPVYGHTIFSPLLVFIKNLLNYSFFTDPVLIFILLPFTAWRIYKAWRRQLELRPVYDSMLIAGSMYVMGYFVLNAYSPLYLLPAYIFTLPPLIYFFGQREHRTLLGKGAAAVCGAALLINIFPLGIHYLTYYKYLPINFNKTLDFLISDINSRYPDKRANIFLDAIEPNTGATAYFAFTEFLQYKGLSWERFDFKYDGQAEGTALLNTLRFELPFTVFKNTGFYKIESGDYLVVPSEATAKNITRAYIQSLNKDYQLLFRTKSPLAFPSFNLKTPVKYFLSQRLSRNQKEEGVMINENLMHWPDYYVFIKR